jgi:hypothetical protein
MPACPTAKQLLASGQLTPESPELTHLAVDHVIPASADDAIEPSSPTATHVALKQLTANQIQDPTDCMTTDQFVPTSALRRMTWPSPTAIQADVAVQLTPQRVLADPDRRAVQL